MIDGLAWYGLAKVLKISGVWGQYAKSNMFFNPCLFSFFSRLGADPTSANTRRHVDSFLELPEPGFVFGFFSLLFQTR